MDPVFLSPAASAVDDGVVDHTSDNVSPPSVHVSCQSVFLPPSLFPWQEGVRERWEDVSDEEVSCTYTVLGLSGPACHAGCYDGSCGNGRYLIIGMKWRRRLQQSHKFRATKLNE